MKNKLFISNVRKIKSSIKRFFSLLFMALLGVGFFVGIKSASPDMLDTLDEYLDQHHTYDLEIISTLGLTEEDVNAIKKLGIASQVVGIRSFDELVLLDQQEKIIKVTSLSDMNQVTVTEGRLPKQSNEIVVEKKLLSENNLSIGDFISIPNAYLNNEEYEIVGVIESPLYFSNARGTTVIGNGQLNYYTYVCENAFRMEHYTNIEILLQQAQETITSSQQYENIVADAKTQIEQIKKDREDARYQFLYQEQIKKMGDLGTEVDSSKFIQPKWYILDRNDNQAYTTFVDATESLKQIGNVFPLIFYIVAILISLISMTRMVDEDRTEIGTLKGLGFSNFHIISKYVLYSFLATTIGGLIGMIIGSNLLPRVIWSIYQALFLIPTFCCKWNQYYAMIGLSMALLCICGASIIAAMKTLREKPSELMRPKAPKIGKSIGLEKISFFWNRLTFSNKITIRNIFRYQKRIIVTIIGIAGSTSLVLVGFGLKDSVNNVVNYNYDHVFIYDEMIRLKSNTDTTTLENLLEEQEEIDVAVFASYEVMNLYNSNNESLEVNVIAPATTEQFSQVIQLNDFSDHKKMISLTDQSVVLSEKLAKTLNIKVGDQVSFLVHDVYKKVKVENIVENYIYDYVYMTKNTYQSIFGEYTANVVFLKTVENYNEKVNKGLLKQESVSNVISTKMISSLLADVLSSLDSVVIILIVASAILAFVILYNLSTINISERKREISTLKVLGFYDEEVDAYITKENYFITVIGIAIGLLVGLYLSHYVISTCEPQFLMFIRHVEPTSYIISALISFVFTIIVNRITHYNLKKIDMVESLKNNE